MSYVYIRSEPSLWTVGFYRPDGQWEPESDHGERDEAAKRAAWLNGSTEDAGTVAGLRKRIAALESDTPQARQLQLEADQAAADLAESGYGEPW